MKDFDQWNKKKISLHQGKYRNFFKEREIWFASLGCNVGYEQDGKGGDFLRPILILTKFNLDMFWGIPLTSRLKEGKYHMIINHGFQMSSAILSQLKLFDTRRLVRCIGKITHEEISIVKKRLIEILSL